MTIKITIIINIVIINNFPDFITLIAILLIIYIFKRLRTKTPRTKTPQDKSSTGQKKPSLLKKVIFSPNFFYRKDLETFKKKLNLSFANIIFQFLFLVWKLEFISYVINILYVLILLKIYLCFKVWIKRLFELNVKY